MNIDNLINKIMRERVQHYSPKKYWKMREVVISKNSRFPKILKLFYLFRIKRMDAFNNASMGTNLGYGAEFLTPPILPHGLNGIIVGHNARIGSNCTIYHQATITGDYGGNLIIGDNCMIGTGAKIIGNIIIGDNILIGAGCVVVKDLPDNCTAVGNPARIIKHGELPNT